MHAVELPAGSRQVARDARAGCQHDRVEARAKLLNRKIAADVNATADLNALGHQLLYASLDNRLLDLEVRHAEADEPADRLVALEQGHAMARSAQLLRGRHACRPRADDRDRLARFAIATGRLRRHPTLAPCTVDDRVLDLFDRDRVTLADLEHARRLARGGAQPAGELGKVVRRVQLGDRVLEAVAVDEVVPVGDQVAERASVVAKRHAAVHAARALVAQLRVGPRQ